MKLTKQRTLRWCLAHDEPVIVYHDKSWRCWWQTIVETSDETQCEPVAFSKRPKPETRPCPGCDVFDCDGDHP